MDDLAEQSAPLSDHRLSAPSQPAVTHSADRAGTRARDRPSMLDRDGGAAAAPSMGVSWAVPSALAVATACVRADATSSTLSRCRRGRAAARPRPRPTASPCCRIRRSPAFAARIECQPVDASVWPPQTMQRSRGVPDRRPTAGGAIAPGRRHQRARHGGGKRRSTRRRRARRVPHPQGPVATAGASRRRRDERRRADATQLPAEASTRTGPSAHPRPLPSRRRWRWRCGRRPG